MSSFVYFVGGFVFFAIMAVAMRKIAGEVRVQNALRRRLGTPRDDSASLLRNEERSEKSAFALILSESGLGWDLLTFAKRTMAAMLVGALVGTLLGGIGYALLFAFLAAPLCWAWVRRARSKRMAQCNTQMPQALEVMALALRAGHPLPGALALAAAEAPAPICDELRRASDEHELGRPIGDVLIGLGERLSECDTIHTFVTAVLVLQETGGNIISVIDRIVENARARTHYESRLRAMTAEGRMSAMFIGALPGVFLCIGTAMDPNYAQVVYGDPAGLMLLSVVGALWMIGVVWSRAMVRTKA